MNCIKLLHVYISLSSGWGKSYGYVLMWIHVCLAFAVIRAANLCLQGSCVCWQNGTSIDDGSCNARDRVNRNDLEERGMLVVINP